MLLLIYNKFFQVIIKIWYHLQNLIETIQMQIIYFKQKVKKLLQFKVL